MIILSLKKHFPARAPEWFGSFTIAFWGAHILMHPGVFSDPRYGMVWSGMVQASEPTWGLAAFTIGILGACALFINGAYTRTPLIRLLAAFIRAFIWTQVAIGVYRSEVPNPGLIMYVSAVVGDIYSVYRAGIDATYAERERRETKAENKDRARNHILA